MEATVSSPRFENQPFSLLGVDPFSDQAFRDYLNASEGVPYNQLAVFLTQPGALLISSETAKNAGVEIGERFSIDIGGEMHEVFVAGLINPVDSISARTLAGTLLADIATFQEITGRFGYIDHIDLIIDPQHEEDSLANLRSFLPEGYQVVNAASRSSSITEMTGAFQLNLTALSLLALLVGLFLIYNTMTYSVVRRRSLFGLLRCLGVTRFEIVAMVVGEAFLVGLVGSILGLGLGLLLGQQTVSMVNRTVNDLYYTTTVQPGGFEAASLYKGVLLGLVATSLAALIPALEASLVPPQAALARSGLETKTRRLVWFVSLAGLVLAGAGYAVLRYPSQDVNVGFGGTLLMVVGLAMETSLVLILFMNLLRPVSGGLLGFLGRMAPANLVNNLSRTSVAAASLMVAVAVAIAMSLMVKSFRSTVTVWLEQTLHGDIYISAPSFISTNSTESINPEIITKLERWPQVDRVDTLRTVRVESADGPVTLNATYNPDFGYERLYARLDVPKDRLWNELNDGGILITEALAYRLDLFEPGISMRLLTETGWQVFPIVGIIYEYTSSEGSVWMAYDLYRAHWNDPGLTALALRLDPSADPDQVSQVLAKELSPIQRLNIRPNRVLRADVLEVFDRTFAITNAMQGMVTVVAFIGVLTTALLLQLEKQRELGILRALGLTARQLWNLVMLESGLMGVVAGVLAIPTGYVLAWVLVDVINRRSFGWTLRLDTPVSSILQGFATAVFAALLAGLYPAWRINRMAAAEAIRYE